MIGRQGSTYLCTLPDCPQGRAARQSLQMITATKLSGRSLACLSRHTLGLTTYGAAISCQSREEVRELDSTRRVSRDVMLHFDTNTLITFHRIHIAFH